MTSFANAQEFLNSATEPRNLEVLGSEIAKLCSTQPITAVLTFEDTIDSIVGHIVARELGVDRCTAILDLGKITMLGDLPVAGALLLVALLDSNPSDVRALRAYVGDTNLHLHTATLASESAKLAPAAPLTLVVQ